MNAKLTLKTLTSVVLFSTVFSSSNANATLFTYTSRALWEADVGPVATEHFEPFPGGTNGNSPFNTNTAPFSYTTAEQNFTFSHPGPSFSFDLIAGGNPTGNSSSQFALVRDFFGVGMQIAFPGLTSAFGFDYQFTPNEIFVLAISSVVPTFTLTSGPSQFIGFIDDAASHSSFTITSANNFGSGLFIDNISIPPGPTGVPEPATFALFGAGLALLGAMRRRKDRNLA